MKLLYFIILLPTIVMAHNGHRPDSHAPIGVMADHTHLKGEWMLAFRHSQMHMSTIINETDTVTEDEHFSETSYMMAPKTMQMSMKMLGGMYALTDKLTLSAGLPYIDKQMTMVKKMGRTEVDSTSNGIGDLKVNALWNVFEKSEKRLVLLGGLVLPTGSTTKYDNGSRLGYKMQLGAGSYGIRLGSTYFHFFETWSLGAQFILTKYLNENSEKYTLGNTYQTNLWAMKNVKDSLGVSLRVEQINTDPLASNEENLSVMSSGTDPKVQHGMKRFSYIGLNYFAQAGTLKGHRFALEYGTPMGHDVSGYELGTDSKMILGWQKAY